MAVSVDDKQTNAVQARERGNALYKQGKLDEAEIAYKEASSLAPDDPSPVSNLSAVKFETGRFEQAAELAAKALSLSEDAAQDRKDRLLIRLAKSYLHAGKFSDSLAAAKRMAEGKERDSLIVDLNLLLGLERQSADASSARKNIATRLPRYRPVLQDVA